MAECRYRAVFFKENDINYTVGEYNRTYSKETILAYADYLVKQAEPFSIAICVADNYQALGKKYGSTACENLLSITKETIIKNVNTSGLVGRYGDDRYIVLLDGINEYNDVWRIFHAINSDLLEKTIPDSEENVSLTSGISRFPIDNRDVDGLLLTTNKALFRGQEKGKACFIIYLAAKHSNIVISEQKTTDFSTVEILSDIFDIANSGTDIKTIADRVIHSLGEYLGPDHICIQADNQIIAQYIGPNSKKKEISTMNYEYIKDRFDNRGLFFVSNRKASYIPNDLGLYNFYSFEGINSALTALISCNGIVYGILRVEMVGNSHTWESKDKVLYTLTAKLLATILNDRNKKLI